jgi:hypothetical protein
MNPIEGERAGTMYWMPANMTDASKEPPDPVAPKMIEASPDEEPDDDNDDTDPEKETPNAEK